MPNYKPIIPPEQQSEKEKKLLAERERIDTKLTYHKHRLKALEHEEAELVRKARNHRIFTRGGMLESFLLKPTLLSDDQVHSLLKIIFHKPEINKILNHMISIEPPVEEEPELPADVPPDPAISEEARNAFGYTDDAMLPLTKERAMELFERDVPVYLLYGDNTEAMAFEHTEILNHDGIFGIDRADWEAVKEQFPIATENKWQKAFLENPADSYCIYQLKRTDETAELLFMSSNYLKEHNLDISYENYDAVYSGAFSGSDDNPTKTLDDLYMKFNTDRPQDFTGHSLSVSDIVALRQNGVVSCHYVDSVGFADVPAFLPENYLKNAEMAMEDDYGMIDGIINNGSKEQPEFKAKVPDLTALFEEAKRTVQEYKASHDDGRKQSVIARLHTPTPPRNDKTAQTKSAERDLL